MICLNRQRQFRVLAKPVRGFALLYAVLVSSIILVVTLTLNNIIYKQLILSSIGRQSQIAYFSADAARECIKYHDNQNIFDPPNSGTINCTGSPIPISWSPSNVMNPISIDYQYNDNGNPLASCAKITSQATIIGGRTKFTFTIAGYNVSCLAIQTNRRVVERQLHWKS